MSISETTVGRFEQDVLNAKVPVLVDFWAPWCGPCRTQDPILQSLAAGREDIRIVKVNVDDNQELAARFQVRGIPSLILFNGGELVANKVGVTSLGELEQWVDNNVTTTA